MSEKYKEIVKEVDASFAENNPEVFFNHCAENVEWRMAGKKATKGLGAIREWMASMPDHGAPAINSRNIVAEGNSVSSYGSMTMKNETGEEISYDYCDIYRFENEKIAELISFVIKSEE